MLETKTKWFLYDEKLKIEIKVNLPDWHIQYQIEEANYEQ